MRRPGTGVGRRSGFRGIGGGAPWTPARLTSLRAWYRSDLGITLSGSDVTAWADQSGIGNHLTDGGVSARRPAYSASDAAFGSRPSLTFDGVAEYLSDAAFSLGGDTALCSIAMLYQQVGYTSGDVVVIYNTGGNNRPVFLQPATANALAWLPAGGATQSVTTTAFNDSIARLVIGTWDGGTGRLYTGSTQEDSDVNAGADFADGGAFAVGATTAGSVPASFRVAELIVQRAAMTEAERTALHAYAISRYGVP
jgi:hypothetical protein